MAGGAGGGFLTDLYVTTPPSWYRKLRDWMGVTEEAHHEWICSSLGCSCDASSVDAP